MSPSINQSPGKTTTDSTLLQARYLVTIEPDGRAYLCTGEQGTLDLDGDITLGVFTASSPIDAMRQAGAEISEAALPAAIVARDPESLGMKTYLLK